MVPNALTFLDAAAFQRPELMDEQFVRWLDMVCARAAIPIVITDDGRDADSPNPTGSAGKHSLHRRGRAVDLRTRNWTSVQKWRLLTAIVLSAGEAPGGVEWEPVYSPTDRHWHLAVDDQNRTHRFLEADE